MLTFQWIFFLFHDIQSKYSKNNTKEEIECEVPHFDEGHETNNKTDFKIKTADNFPCLLISFTIFHKITLKIWLVNTLMIFH